MESVIITKIDEYVAYGKDESDMEVLVTKIHRIPEVKIGDEVLGYFLNDDDDDFYFEAVQIA